MRVIQEFDDEHLDRNYYIERWLTDLNYKPDFENRYYWDVRIAGEIKKKKEKET